MTTSSSLILQAWGGHEATIRKRIRGPNNQILFVWGLDRELVLRLYRTADRQRIAEEHRLLLALQQASLQFAIPAPIPTVTGQTTTQLIWNGQQVLAALFPMLPGGPPEDGNSRHVAACGRALGQLHTAMDGLPDALDLRDACPAIDQVDPQVSDPVAAAASCGRDTSERRQLTGVIERASASDEISDLGRPQIIHADPFGANLLVRDDSVSAVLDFEYAGFGPTAMDVAVATLSLCLTPLTRTDRWALTSSFAAGYTSVRPLPPQAIEKVPALMRRRETVSFVNRIGRHRRGEITTAELQDRATRLVDLDRWLTTHANVLVAALSAPTR